MPVAPRAVAPGLDGLVPARNLRRLELERAVGKPRLTNQGVTIEDSGGAVARHNALELAVERGRNAKRRLYGLIAGIQQLAHDPAGVPAVGAVGGPPEATLDHQSLGHGGTLSRSAIV